MTKPAPNSEQTVETLLGERQRYEEWIAALEARRESTPSHIYERVHADYTARLQRVVEQLNSQRAALQKLEHAIMDRLTSMDMEEARHRDEAAEAELRASVGELTPEEHDEVVHRTQAALADLREARDAAVPELTRIRAVLQRGAEPKKTDGEDAASEPSAASEAPAQGTSGFDELNFLKSLVESPNGSSGSGANAAQPAPKDERDVRRQPEREETPAPPSLREEVPEPSVPTSGGRRGASLDVQHEESPLLKSVQPDQVKTLKCQECGTHNYATEWYCERCGAELAAL